MNKGPACAAGLFFTIFSGMKKCLLPALMLALAIPVPGQVFSHEPDIETAKLWWPDMFNTWTPVSWPDHYHKFGVVYNGTLVLSPAPRDAFRPHSHRWDGEDFQLTFSCSEDGRPWAMPGTMTILRKYDGGLGIQNWVPGHETPILRTVYPNKSGYVMSTEVFAHITSGAAVETALEPLYAWVRIKLDKTDAYYHPEHCFMSARLSRVFLTHGDHWEYGPDIDIHPEMAPYPKELTIKRSGEYLQVVEPDARIRLTVLGGDEKTVKLSPLGKGEYNLTFDFGADDGRFFDILLPMLSDDPADTGRELTLGRDASLAAADAYWKSLRPATAATFEVPEQFVNEAVERNFSIAQVLTEKDYINGEYSYISGQWGYDGLWGTPASMVNSMFLDQMGWFPMTEKYTDALLIHQGSRLAAGPSFKPHPGFLCMPPHIVAIDWFSDHGANMHQIATHALLSGDKDYIAKWTGPLEKAFDYVIFESMSDHPGVPGIIPAAFSSDEGIPLQSVWNISWTYKGMATTLRLFEKIGHPRAAEFREFMDGYRNRFLEAYRKAAADGDKWTDSKGAVRFRPPNSVGREGECVLPEWMMVRIKGAPEGYTFMSDAFYLDGGPLILVWAGLLDAGDPLMTDLTAYFREGPNWELRKPVHHSCDRPVLVHEISSCEPCYSFNIFHDWALGDRQLYLEGMYSMFAGAISRNTFISCEHRHGVQGNIFAFPLAFILARLAVIDDQIEPGSLHLLRLCPLAWLSPDKPSRFLSMPTEFGPVDLTAQLSGDRKTLEISFKASSDSFRDAPESITVHVPPVPGLKTVRVNGKKYSASRGEIKL